MITTSACVDLRDAFPLGTRINFRTIRLIVLIASKYVFNLHMVEKHRTIEVLSK